MSFRARLETDNHKVFPLLLPDGTTGGKGLLAFIIPLELLCRGEVEPKVRNWFETLKHDQPLCELVQPLLRSWYDGHWNYQFDEYDRYLQNYIHAPMTEAAFSEIRTLNNRWSNTQALCTSTKELLLLLTSEDRTETWWYHPQATLLELPILINTIEHAEKGSATAVRICFM
ncbi:MAG: hypothetical protein GFH27_549311n82 [Chloroflexi bacterium AL-W]|nr:hypothetical protein [Chloroflexi bacterium AL-N1]NOK68740.1 hypothetical protein [Chloroflexi bacterium AL-N10]NOK76226.1 hypothetical protein [Chloroflexi bacterium AL-N5]NOK84137.1 hypothetical protein [Chloroflexi bacterium AL-W]NOK91364.1 hypothetical protein [Chloroflexi bacterium AL-N15]